MKVRELVNVEPIWVSPQLSVADVTRVMEECGCSFMPVLQDGEAVGVVTDRDVALALAVHGANPSSTRTHEIMSQPVFGIAAESSPEEAAAEMIARNVRRLIVHEDGRFVGVVSVVDLAGLINDQQVAQTLHAMATQNQPHDVRHQTAPVPGQYLG